MAGRGGPVLPPAVPFPAITVPTIVRIVLHIVAAALQQPAAFRAVEPQFGQVGVGVAEGPEGGAALRVRVLDAVQAGRAGAVRQIVPAGRLGRHGEEEEGRGAVVGRAERREKGGGAGRGCSSGPAGRSSGARPLPAPPPPSRAAARLSHCSFGQRSSHDVGMYVSDLLLVYAGLMSAQSAVLARFATYYLQLCCSCLALLVTRIGDALARGKPPKAEPSEELI